MTRNITASIARSGIFPKIDIRPRFLIVPLGQLFAGIVKVTSGRFAAAQSKVNATSCRNLRYLQLGQAQHRSGDGQVPRDLRDGDDSDEAPQGFAQNPRDHGQRIADNRYPTQ